MTETLRDREKAEVQRAILDLFATLTGLPVALYEEMGGDLDLVSLASSSRENHQEHCTFIQTLSGGKAACDADHCSRANRAIKTSTGGLTLCYAGMYNETVPIVVKGEVRGALVYGEMQIDSPEHKRAALERHQRAVEQLGLSSDEAAQLRNLLTNSRTYEPRQLEAFRKFVASVERWFYSLVDKEDLAANTIERVTHEIRARLQAVIGHAENLATYATTVPPWQAAEIAREVLSSALALNTVIQTLGGYLSQYRFRPHFLSRVLWEAKWIYEPEATNRGIEIRLELRPDEQPVTVALPHFQHAVNNLVHNAVKYSFNGGSDRDRYVQLALQMVVGGCNISIENYGVGILPEEITSRAIFRKGYKGKLTQGEFRTGTGKGLSFVEAVIKQHHGRIEVLSKHLGGEQNPEGRPHRNRFTVFVPFCQPGD
jgi:signal transduction histidine kinase